ncbi:MAG TPA: hypothetical protein PLB18_14555, partial [Acidobacteriota bacterium]|nr:hypothetical protein [Acidobacteriota bacterium]
AGGGVELVVGDAHALVDGLHVLAGVLEWPPGDGADEFDQPDFNTFEKRADSRIDVFLVIRVFRGFYFLDRLAPHHNSSTPHLPSSFQEKTRHGETEITVFRSKSGLD